MPTGMTAFNAWVNDIVALSGLPDNDSTRRVAAELILKVRPSVGYMPLRHVVNNLIKAASNQVAIQVIKDTENGQQQQPQDTQKVT